PGRAKADGLALLHEFMFARFREGGERGQEVGHYNGAVRALLGFLLAAGFALAAHKPQPTPTVRTSNADVELTATLYADPAAIQELIGSDLGGYYVVVDVKLAPRNNEKIKIWRDDFQLKTDRDGERSKPYAPSQIAGKGALVVSQTEDGQSRTGLGIGIGMIGMGGGGAQPTNTSKMDRGSKSKEAPVLSRLEEKVLKEQET